MGLLSTRWEAQYEGHNITVSRNEFTKGFMLEWDGKEVARRGWSFVGLGELHGSAELNGRPVDLHVTLDWGDGVLKGIGTDGKCVIRVDGKELAGVKHVR